MTPEEISNVLSSLEENWNSRCEIWATSGCLYLVDQKSKMVLSRHFIPCDGGDPYIRRDGENEFIDLRE